MATQTRDELETLIAELYAEGRNGYMFSEAKAQWLESELESYEEYPDKDYLDDLRGWTLYWLEQHMNDCSPEELSPGGIYHWMVLATEQSCD